MTEADLFEQLDEIGFEAGLGNEIALFSAYLGTMENFLATEAKERMEQLREARNERLRRLREDMQAAGRTDPFAFDSGFPTSDEEFLWHEIDGLDDFVNKLRTSFFIALYAFLEAALDDICYRQEKYGHEPYSVFQTKHPKIKGIDRAKEYLRKIIGADFCFGTDLRWNTIKNYQKLRICIVHNQGQLNERFKPCGDRDALSRYVAQNRTLSLSPGGEIIFSEDFCIGALSTIGSFFEALLTSLSRLRVCPKTGVQTSLT